MRALYDVAAPAKLNLFLHITGRRPDGFHELQSAFVMIDWCDTLHFELRNDGRLTRDDIGAHLPADDLVIRAARALQRAGVPAAGAHITLEKRIPQQAGLGGGSSDAASCLIALNRLWKLGLSLDRLCELGIALGADVPFFLRGGNAWVEGIGERIQPLELPTARFAVVKPAEGLETARVFTAPDLVRNTPAAIISGFAQDPFGFGRNDLEPVARRLCPQVAQAVQWLASQGFQGRMSGSGSAVFAPVVGNARLADVPHGWVARVCGSLKAHPLAGWA